jgi:hypothetical protein
VLFTYDLGMIVIGAEECKFLKYNRFMDFPESVRALLWEYDPDDPAVADRLERVIMERVMERGGWDAMQWLLGSFGREKLRRFLDDRGCRVLPARELRFWAWVCGVPDGVTRNWVGQARARELAWRG